MSVGGFNLRKWSSNSDDLTKSIDTLESRETDRLTGRSTVSTSDVVQEDSSYTRSTIGKEAIVTETTQVKVLGMAWDTVADAFLFNLAELIEYARSLPVTKRSLLQWSSKIFDPLGFSESEEVLREVVKQPVNVVRSLMANDVLPPVLDLNKVIDINRFSSLKKLLRVTAYVVRFIDALRAARQGKRPVKGKMETLTASEV